MKLASAAILISCLIIQAALDGRQDRGTKTGTSDPRTRFESIAREAGLDFQHTNGASREKYLVETMGSGGLFFDYNNDGWLDVFLVDGGSLGDRVVADRARHRLYRNRGNGTFEDVSAASEIAHGAYGMGACAADVDNDGWIDLYVTGFGSNALHHNNRNGTFTDVTRQAGVGSSLWSASCAFSDIDKDGYLDLFVTRYLDFNVGNNKYCGDPTTRAYCRPHLYDGLGSVLYRNNRNGTFTDISRKAGISSQGKALGVVFGDYDNDGWPDVFVANDSVPNFLYHNEGRGIFKEVGLPAGVSVAGDGRARAGMGTDFGDYDGDGLLDLIVTNFTLETHNIFRNLGGGLFIDATFASGVGAATLRFLGFGTAFFDFDNDGDLDLTIVNGNVLDNASHFLPNDTHAQRNLLFENERGRFTEVGRLSGAGFAVEKVSRALAVGDIDNDGDLDLLVTNNGQSVDLLRNNGGDHDNALVVKAISAPGNRDGVGARIRLIAAGKTQVREVTAGSSYLAQNDLRVHFGLGRASQADRLEILWPSGRTDRVERVAANQIVTIIEGEGVTRRMPFAGR